MIIKEDAESSTDEEEDFEDDDDEQNLQEETINLTEENEQNEEVDLQPQKSDKSTLKDFEEESGRSIEFRSSLFSRIFFFWVQSMVSCCMDY
jgi:hypothetical protein